MTTCQTTARNSGSDQASRIRRFGAPRVLARRGSAVVLDIACLVPLGSLSAMQSRGRWSRRSRRGLCGKRAGKINRVMDRARLAGTCWTLILRRGGGRRGMERGEVGRRGEGGGNKNTPPPLHGGAGRCGAVR